jgi:N-acetylglucosaminyl-diphospho-decaprenol L-rhamnosyltransferase
MDLSIIIVNWNSASFVKRCLETIYANTSGIEFEIVVVDNASRDECHDVIQKHFPTVRFIQSEENLGFAGANNLGVQECRGRNLLFLNPDTEVVGPALQALMHSLEDLSDAGIVGPRLLNSDLSVQTSCIQRFPSILNQTLDSEVLRGLFPDSSLWGTGPLLKPPSSPISVDVIAGACLMAKATVFERVGGFDTGYFMYAEDADLCFKVQQQGWKSYYVPSVSVVHHGGRSSDTQTESHFAAVVMRESVFRFLRTRRGSWYGASFRSVTAAAALFRIGLLHILVAMSHGPRKISCSIALRRWIRLLRWALGMEMWATKLGAQAND